MSVRADDDRAVPAEDRFAFAAFAAMTTININSMRLHWKLAPPQDKERWRRAAAAVLKEAANAG